MGYAAWSFGLSLALGAFIAGLVINESEYAHQALSDVIPLRDLFGMVFFVSVGMLLDPALVWRRIGTVLLVVTVVVIGKSAIFAAVARMFGYRRVVPMAVGLTLFQVGEFAFVLARVGLAEGAITNDQYALVLNTTVATMALTPVISGMTPWLYERLFGGGRGREPLQALNVPDAGFANHVVIAGAGRVGRTVADALAQLSLPCVLVEIDVRRAERARLAGRAVIYGDASQRVVLEAADLERARALIVTTPAYPDVRAIIRTARQLRENVAIVARADGPEAVRDLYALGIQEVSLARSRRRDRNDARSARAAWRVSRGSRPRGGRDPASEIHRKRRALTGDKGVDAANPRRGDHHTAGDDRRHRFEDRKGLTRLQLKFVPLSSTVPASGLQASTVKTSTHNC